MFDIDKSEHGGNDTGEEILEQRQILFKLNQALVVYSSCYNSTYFLHQQEKTLNESNTISNSDTNFFSCYIDNRETWVDGCLLYLNGYKLQGNNCNNSLLLIEKRCIKEQKHLIAERMKSVCRHHCYTHLSGIF